jgi:transcriptional regulator with XRE-family HTH domain
LARADQHETSRQHREYVLWLMEHMRMNQAALAKAAGVQPSTLSRVLKKDGTGTLHARTRSKLEKTSGILLSAVIDTLAAPGFRGLAEDAVPFDAESADPAVSAAIKALIGGREDADSRTIRTRALEGLGYLPGDIVIVDLRRKPMPGDVVFAQVYELGRSEPETVMRIYEPPVLVAASFDGQLQRPLMVDDARVKIEGVVLPHRLRPTTPAA